MNDFEYSNPVDFEKLKKVYDLGVKQGSLTPRQGDDCTPVFQLARQWGINNLYFPAGVKLKNTINLPK